MYHRWLRQSTCCKEFLKININSVLKNRHHSHPPKHQVSQWMLPKMRKGPFKLLLSFHLVKRYIQKLYIQKIHIKLICHNPAFKSILTLSWLEHHPNVPRLQVWSLARVLYGINQWMYKWVEQHINISLSPSFSPFFPLSLWNQ